MRVLKSLESEGGMARDVSECCGVTELQWQWARGVCAAHAAEAGHKRYCL